MRGYFDRGKSLNQLEGHDWGEPTFDSYLVTTCHHLRCKPLIEFTVEDLRIMIGQQISLPYLVPLAVERLEADPLAAGHYYPGDLLAAVIRVDESFWNRHADSLQKVQGVVRRAEQILRSAGEDEYGSLRESIREAQPILTTSG